MSDVEDRIAAGLVRAGIRRGVIGQGDWAIQAIARVLADEIELLRAEISLAAKGAEIRARAKGPMRDR